MSESNLKILKDKWENFNHGNIQHARVEFAAFKNWRTDNFQDNLDLLKLNLYTNIINGNNVESYFTNWLEQRTERCGKFRTASSYSYGIYRINNRDNEQYLTIEQRGKQKDKTPLNMVEADDYFNQHILPILKKLKDFEVLDANHHHLDINYSRKIAYLYNPDKLLPLFKKEVIESIANFIGIEVDAALYTATQPILDKFVNAWELNRDFDTTQKLGAFLWEYFGKGFSLEYKNLIFYGSPGTGKTFTIEGIKQRILVDGDKVNDVFFLAQFHPSYSYEDFIDGLKPIVKEGGAITLELRSGQFKTLCKKAMDNLKNSRKENLKPTSYYFVADEINRAELSRVLGEVLVCLEESKRVDFDKDGNPTKNSLYLKTQYGHLDNKDGAVLTIDNEHYFGIPSNLYFIGTMNDIDRSIDSFDLALRRRFVWQRMDCDYDVIKDVLYSITNIDNYIEICKKINDIISEDWMLGKSYQIGHAYFLDIVDSSKRENNRYPTRISNTMIDNLFNKKISPLLSEYLRSDFDEKGIEKRLKYAKDIFSLNPQINA